MRVRARGRERLAPQLLTLTATRYIVCTSVQAPVVASPHDPELALEPALAAADAATGGTTSTRRASAAWPDVAQSQDVRVASVGDESNAIDGAGAEMPTSTASAHDAASGDEAKVDDGPQLLYSYTIRSIWGRDQCNDDLPLNPECVAWRRRERVAWGRQARAACTRYAYVGVGV